VLTSVFALVSHPWVAVAVSVVLVILLALGTRKRPPFLEGVSV
jgi:hypothetical protein